MNYICWIIYIWTVQPRNGTPKHSETETFRSHWKNETPTETELTTLLDSDWELLTVETLWATCKFSTVVLESPYTRFLSGPPDNPASIHKSGSKSGGVERLSPYLSLNRLLYISWKLKKKSSNSIQENNNLQKKMVERTYHEVLCMVVNKLLHPFFVVFTLHMCLYKKPHWAQLMSKRRVIVQPFSCTSQHHVVYRSCI